MMMFALLAAAALCLAFAGFCFFGLPYLVSGSHMLDRLRKMPHMISAQLVEL